MKFETTDDGSIVIYIQVNDKDTPIKISTDYNEIQIPFHVRYVKI